MNWAKKTKNRLQSVNGSWCEKLREFWQTKWQYLLVVVFGLILTVTLWGAPGRLLIGDDAAFQAVRLTGALHGWMDGQLIPQVDPRALGGFGYGHNLFYGPLLTYAAGLLRLVCMSWPVAINCVMTLCLMGAGLLMCYAMMRISRKQILAATAGVMYMAMPYFLINLYQRVALGEVAAMVLAPLLILGLYQLVNQEEGAVRNLVLAGGGYDFDAFVVDSGVCIDGGCLCTAEHKASVELGDTEESLARGGGGLGGDGVVLVADVRSTSHGVLRHI